MISTSVDVLRLFQPHALNILRLFHVLIVLLTGEQVMRVVLTASQWYHCDSSDREDATDINPRTK